MWLLRNWSNLMLRPGLLRQRANSSQVLCNIALSQRVGDPKRFIHDVLDHLPDCAMDLQQCRPDILRTLYIRMAMQSYGRGDVALAQSRLRCAFDLACAAPLAAETLAKSLVFAAVHLPVPSPIQYVDTVLDNLPAEAAGLRRMRYRVLNKVHVRLSREALLAGKRWQSGRHTLCALRYRPVAIFDRRTAALWLKVLAGG